jgi:hypothetical protein
MSIQSEEKCVADKLSKLSSRSQQQLGINPSHISCLQWSTACFELSGVERNPTPSTKLLAIVRTAKAIISEYTNEVLPRFMLNASIKNAGKPVSLPEPTESRQFEGEGAANSKSTISRMSSHLSSTSGVVSSSLVLSADDLLPIFIFVLCRSRLQTPLQNKELLWNLCHPDQLHGEPGYYLTIYESAVMYVHGVDTSQDFSIRHSEISSRPSNMSEDT